MMTDPYGYVAVLRVALRLHEEHSRGTGRTEMMINNLREGEAVIVASERDERNLRDALRDRGFRGNIEIIHLSSSGFARAALMKETVHWTHEAVLLEADRSIEGLESVLRTTQKTSIDAGNKINRLCRYG
jgi:hypothetical protein